MGELAPRDPLSPPERTPKWSHKKLTDPTARPIGERIASLAKARLTRAMFIKEFLGHRIAPLQVHSHPLWEFTSSDDPMCVHVSGMTHDELD